MSQATLLVGSTGMLDEHVARHLLDQPEVRPRLLVRPGKRNALVAMLLLAAPVPVTAMAQDAAPELASAPQDGAAVAGMEGFTHHFVDVNGTRLHYVAGGEGPTVVLLHGWPYTWAEWRDVMPLLTEAGFTVIAPDLRGLGDSAKPHDGYDNRTVAEDVHQLVQSLGQAEIDLVGTDIGTMVAYAYAAAYPDEVQSLVLAESLIPGFGLEELMDPATGGYWHFGFQAQVDIADRLTRGNEAYYLGWAWDFGSVAPGGIPEADRAEYLRTYAAPGGMRGGFEHYGALLESGQYNRAQFQSPLAMPVLVLNAERGIPQEQTLGGVQRVAANVESDVVPGSGHAFADDNPAWVAERLVRFFGEADAAR